MLRVFIPVILISMALSNERQFDASQYKVRDIRAVRLTSPLTVDGNLDESLYSGPSFSDFIQYTPNNGQRGTEKTEIWVGYDDEALYVGARMWDRQPDSIATRIGRRDDNFNSDLFEVIIDSYHDKRTGYSFQINPSGAIRDETYFNDSWTDLTWDGIWEGQAAIDADGWTAEIRIPYSQLRFTEQEVYTWGIFPTRYIQRRGEWDYYIFIPLEASGAMSRAATLSGIRGIKPPARREYLPYFTAITNNLPDTRNNPFLKGGRSDFAAGVDFKFGLGSNLTLDATINPDFGQVEVDPSEINLSAYETIYNEKRPFFVEGRNIFQFGNGGPTNNWNMNFWEPDLFYSRRIGRAPQGWVTPDVDSDSLDHPVATRILGAAKISGKLAGNISIGGLSSITQREYAHYYIAGDRGKEQVEPVTYYNVARALKEFDEGRYGLGFMGTHTQRDFDGLSMLGRIEDRHSLRDMLASSATVIGVDGWSFIGAEREWALGGWAGYSQVRGSQQMITGLQQNSSHYYQRPDLDYVDLDTNRTSLSGFATRLKLNRETGNVMVNAAFGLITPGFETNDVGVTGTTDRINQHAVIGYRWTEPGEKIRFARTDVAYTRSYDFGGEKSAEMIFWMGYMQLQNYWNLNWSALRSPALSSHSTLRGGPKVIEPAGGEINFNVSSDYRKDVSFSAGLGAGGDEAGGRSNEYDLDVEIKIGQRFNINVGPQYRKSLYPAYYIDAIEDEDNVAMYGRRYVVGQLNRTTVSADIRLEYTFTPWLTLQAYIQPYLSAGSYSRFKEFTRPNSYEFLEYGEGGSTIAYSDSTAEYTIDPTGGDDADSFRLGNPDFNYKALVGTTVLRWEFSPGSTLYLVWTHNGGNSGHPGDFNLGRDLRSLLTGTADDMIALKVSYWLGG